MKNIKFFLLFTILLLVSCNNLINDRIDPDPPPTHMSITVEGFAIDSGGNALTDFPVYCHNISIPNDENENDEKWQHSNTDNEGVYSFTYKDMPVGEEILLHVAVAEEEDYTFNLHIDFFWFKNYKYREVYLLITAYKSIYWLEEDIIRTRKSN